MIKDTLQILLGLTNSLSKSIIMHCIQTIRLAVLWNGNQLVWFSPLGDAMSLYIFVLNLHGKVGPQTIQSAVEEGKWKTIKLSHLFLLMI